MLTWTNTLATIPSYLLYCHARRAAAHFMRKQAMTSTAPGRQAGYHAYRVADAMALRKLYQGSYNIMERGMFWTPIPGLPIHSGAIARLTLHGRRRPRMTSQRP